MNRKKLKALFCEISSRCAPIRGIFSAPPTDRERLIQYEMRQHQHRMLKKKETEALTRLLEEELGKIQSKDELVRLLQTLQQSYAPEEIPDSFYIQFITLANTYDCTELLPEHFYQ